MKCPNCGAEVGNTKFCEFCGSQITAEMQKEQERINKAGCPKCGSSNIQFTREKQGEAKGKKGTEIMRVTTGLCKDCGYTWQTQDTPKKKKTWLWVLGWLFIFPVPLTIILLRKKDMNKILKYGIIAVAWIAYLAIGFSGGGDSASNTVTTTENGDGTSVSISASADETAASDSVSIEIQDGVLGDYGKEMTLSAGTDMEETLIVYYVPAGKYTVKNLGEYRTQVSVYNGVVNNPETGYDEYTDVGDVIVLDADGEGEIEVPEGWFIEIHGAHILLTAE